MVKFKKLGDLCYISSGGTPKRTITDYWDNGKIPWVKISDIKSKHILNTDERITKQGLENSSAKLFPKDTIVYTIFATVGEVGILDITAATNQAIAGIQVKDRTQLRVDYLYYFLKSIKKSVQFLGRGVAQNNINLSVLKSISVPIPSFQEQTAIVKVLDSLNGQIKNKHKQLTLLSQLIKARFVEMFGDPINNSKNWKLINIKKCCVDILGGGTPSKSHPEFFTGSVPWVTPKDMKENVITDSKDHITYEAISNSSAKLIPSNSVLMVIRSGILKHTLPVAINKNEVTINQDMKAFVPTSEISPIFLENYFIAISPDILSKVRSVTADNINFKSFQKRKIILPPISLQNEFANFVQQVDKSKFENIVYLNKMLLMKILSQLGDVSRD